MARKTVESDNQDLMQTLLDVFGPDAMAMMESGSADADESATQPTRSLEEILAEVDSELLRNGQVPKTVAFGAKAANKRATDTKHILVQLDQSILAVPISHVLEVQRVPSITTLPNVPEWLRGVSNLRGEIISVVDARTFFNLPTNDHGIQRRLIIVQSLQLDRSSGFIFDRLVGTHSIDEPEIKLSPAHASSSVSRFLKGTFSLGSESVGVVDLERLMSCEEMSQFASA